MGRPPNVRLAVLRRIEAGRKAGRLGVEHEAEIAIVLRLAGELASPTCPPTALATISRELTTHLRVLGLAPTATGPGELETLLRELREG
jgi:hypothetical protein